MAGDITSGVNEVVAPYLSGQGIGLRAPALEDADAIAAWDDAPMPRNPDQGRELLRRSEQTPWGNAEHVRLMIIELATQEIVGCVLIERQQDRIGKIRIVSSSVLSVDRRDQIEGEVLALIVPWLRDELDLMVLVLEIASDREAVISWAERLGLVEVVRLREHIQRPQGRVDRLTLEMINPAWRHVLQRDDGAGDA